MWSVLWICSAMTIVMSSFYKLLVPIIPWRSLGNHGDRQASKSTKGHLLLVALIFSELFKMEGPPWRLGQYPEGWHSREDYWSLHICFQCSTSAHMIHATIPALVPIKGPFCRATKTAVAFRPTWGDFEVVWWHNTVTDHMGAFVTLWQNRGTDCQQALPIRGRRDGSEVQSLYENEREKNPKSG